MFKRMHTDYLQHTVLTYIVHVELQFCGTIETIVLKFIYFTFCDTMVCKCGLCCHAVSVCLSRHVREFCQNE